MISSSDILKARILIVDDQEANVSLLEQMLRDAGYVAIASTRDPHEVCALHRQNRYDLILLDLQMPGLDGFQVMENLKKIETGGYLPVLVITAQPGHKLRALKSGAKDFVSKPFDLPEVLIRVYNMLEIRLLHLNEVRSHARLENSQRIAALGDWEYDFGHHRLVWSEEIYRILGIAPKDFPPDTETFYGRVHPEDLAFVQREKKSAAEGSRRVKFEHRVIRPNGEVRYIHQITETIFDDQGRPARESGTLQDISERKVVENALRQSEARFKFVARAMSDVVWDWDLSANTLWWNDGFLTLFGFVADEIEPSVESWISRMHPAERTRVVGSMHRAIDAGAESWNADYRFQRKDGSYAFVQDRGYIVRDAAGKGVRMVGGMRDLTEKRRTEEALSVSELRYRRLFETAQDGILILDADTGMVVDVNPFLIALLGFSREQFLGKAIWELGFFKDIVANEDRFAELREKEYLRYENMPLETIDGRRIEVEFISNVYLVNGGKVIQCDVRDVSARRKAEEAVRQLHAELEQRVIQRTAELETANKELEAFSYSVSHDLRTPLRAIDGFSQVVLERFGPLLPVDGRRHLQTIRSGAQKMGALIDALLAFARLNRQELSKRPIDTGTLVRSTLAELGSPWPDRPIEIRTGDLPASSGDPVLLKQVWLNLLSNALKYTRKREKAAIEIGCVKTGGADTFFVRDNGTGFDMRYADKLFGVFQRFHRAEDYEGTGVGLAIVQRIVHRHGGRIWAEAAVDRGATFYFTLEKETIP